jgi:hypothetical protein
VSVLTLTAAKEHLNITVATYDAELQATIDAAEGIIGQEVGPLTPTAVTDRVWSNGYQIMLRTTPVISLTSVTSVYATQTADVASLFVSPAGVVTWGTGRYYFFGGYYDVTYQAGRSTVPDALLFAVKELVRHLWTTQQGGGVRPGSAPQSTTPGFLIPNMVREAMEPYVQDFGFA